MIPRRPSPTPSCSSADKALFELIGVHELSAADDDDDVQEAESASKPLVEYLNPPDNCLRPDIPHSTLLLLIRNALSSSQCSYIIGRGYQVSNDGGQHFGPNYVYEAAHDDSMRVKLQNPNHHKVCVFKDDMILIWIQRFVQDMAFGLIQEWRKEVSSEEFSSEDYTINPRLRLLRYDAIDDDVFLPHFDATTTMMWRGKPFESKLTILCYLNAEFCGGETLFLDSLHPKEGPLIVTPNVGQVVIFNHELYHSSNRLVYDSKLKIQQPILGESVSGGTKFVLRSDVMFAQTEIQRCDNIVPQERTTDSGGVTLSSMFPKVQCSMLQQKMLLDCFGDISTRAFLVPGREKLLNILADLGFNATDRDQLLEACESSIV